MKTASQFLALLFMLSFSFSCSEGRGYEEAPYEKTEGQFQEQPQDGEGVEEEEPAENEDIMAGRQIIKSADLKMQVRTIGEGSEKIKAIVRKFKGFVGTMEMSRSNYEARNTFTVRLDQKNFDKFLSEVEKQAVFVNHLNVTSQDVTEEFVDIQSRLKTKKEVRDRYIDILRNKTGSVEDVLAAEDKIRHITEEIEAKEGRLRFLKNRVSLSTIRVEIYEKLEFEASPEVLEDPFFRRLKESFSDGWEVILSLLVFFVRIWPFLLIGGILFVFRTKIFGFLKRKKK